MVREFQISIASEGSHFVALSRIFFFDTFQHTAMADAKPRSLRLLCLDGGGVRGLASLLVLERLLQDVGDPRPCEYFDMICGTSTGECV